MDWIIGRSNSKEGFHCQNINIFLMFRIIGNFVEYCRIPSADTLKIPQPCTKLPISCLYDKQQNTVMQTSEFIDNTIQTKSLLNWFSHHLCDDRNSNCLYEINWSSTHIYIMATLDCSDTTQRPPASQVPELSWPMHIPNYFVLSVFTKFI